MQTLHHWLVAQAGDVQLVWLDETDRFGPLALVSWSTGDLIKPNLSIREAEDWLDHNRASKYVPSKDYLTAEHRKWMLERRLRAVSLHHAKGSCSDTGACGQ